MRFPPLDRYRVVDLTVSGSCAFRTTAGSVARNLDGSTNEYPAVGYARCSTSNDGGTITTANYPDSSAAAGLSGDVGSSSTGGGAKDQARQTAGTAADEGKHV